MQMFRKQSDFEAFERVMVEAHQRQPIRILSCELDGSFNAPLTAKELDQVRVSIERGRPYGGDEWVRQTVKDLGLEHTVRPEGRPRKASQSATDSTK
jgi:hypothetical protein